MKSSFNCLETRLSHFTKSSLPISPQIPVVWTGGRSVSASGLRSSVPQTTTERPPVKYHMCCSSDFQSSSQHMCGEGRPLPGPPPTASSKLESENPLEGIGGPAVPRPLAKSLRLTSLVVLPILLIPSFLRDSSDWEHAVRLCVQLVGHQIMALRDLVPRSLRTIIWCPTSCMRPTAGPRLRRLASQLGLFGSVD